MADNSKPTDKEAPSITSKLEKLLDKGETIITGRVTRVVDAATGNVHFSPTSDIRQLNLEGHRIGTGDLVIAHSNGNEPQKLDAKRIDGDPTKVGAEIAIVHTGRQ